MVGSAFGGGAGFSISSCSGVRDIYMESRESLTDVWRVLVEGLRFAADFLGGSGVFRLMVV